MKSATDVTPSTTEAATASTESIAEVTPSKYIQRQLYLIQHHSLPNEQWRPIYNIYISDHDRWIGRTGKSIQTHTIVRCSAGVIRLYLLISKVFLGYDPARHYITKNVIKGLLLHSNIVLIDKNPDEIWRDIPLCINYQASNLGRIRNAKSNRVLNQEITNNGYCRVAVKFIHDTKHHLCLVHRLVYMAFYPDVDLSAYVVNHLDSVKTNNNINNLESCTQSENIQHSIESGTYLKTIRQYVYDNVTGKHTPVKKNNNKSRINTSDFIF